MLALIALILFLLSPFVPAFGPWPLVTLGLAKDLDGGAHPWVLVTDDGPGDIYRCPDCGAVDTD